MSLLQSILASDEDFKRSDHFKSVGILRGDNEISRDIYQMTTLEKCFSTKDDR